MTSSTQVAVAEAGAHLVVGVRQRIRQPVHSVRRSRIKRNRRSFRRITSRVVRGCARRLRRMRRCRRDMGERGGRGRGVHVVRPAVRFRGAACPARLRLRRIGFSRGRLATLTKRYGGSGRRRRVFRGGSLRFGTVERARGRKTVSGYPIRARSTVDKRRLSVSSRSAVNLNAMLA